MSKTTEHIAAGHVRILFHSRTRHDSRNTASRVNSVDVPSRGCVAEAWRIDFYGDQDLGAVAGHGVTIVWPSGRTRNVRA